MSHSDLLVSFFSLVKNNNGFFKSEKQAGFLLSSTDNGVYITRQTMTFGEYEGRTQRNSASVEWCVNLDNQGVTKMVKRTSKGESVHFERTHKFFDKIAAKKATMIAEHNQSKRMQISFEIENIKKELSGAVTICKEWESKNSADMEGMSERLMIRLESVYNQSKQFVAELTEKLEILENELLKYN